MARYGMSNVEYLTLVTFIILPLACSHRSPSKEVAMVQPEPLTSAVEQPKAVSDSEPKTVQTKKVRKVAKRSGKRKVASDISQVGSIENSVSPVPQPTSLPEVQTVEEASTNVAANVLRHGEWITYLLAVGSAAFLIYSRRRKQI